MATPIEDQTAALTANVHTFSAKQLYIAAQALTDDATKPGAEFIYAPDYRNGRLSLAETLRDFAQRKFPDYEPPQFAEEFAYEDFAKNRV